MSYESEQGATTMDEGFFRAAHEVSPKDAERNWVLENCKEKFI